MLWGKQSTIRRIESEARLLADAKEAQTRGEEVDAFIRSSLQTLGMANLADLLTERLNAIRVAGSGLLRLEAMDKTFAEAAPSESAEDDRVKDGWQDLYNELESKYALKREAASSEKAEAPTIQKINYEEDRKEQLARAQELGRRIEAKREGSQLESERRSTTNLASILERALAEIGGQGVFQGVRVDIEAAGDLDIKANEKKMYAAVKGVLVTILRQGRNIRGDKRLRIEMGKNAKGLHFELSLCSAPKVIDVMRAPVAAWDFSDREAVSSALRGGTFVTPVELNGKLVGYKVAASFPRARARRDLPPSVPPSNHG